MHNIKLWNINNFECLLNLSRIYIDGYLYSACFLQNYQKIFIVTCNYNVKNNPEAIKVYDFNGNKIKTINYSNEQAVFIDSYFDIKLSKNYIITNNRGHVKSYDFEKNRIYHKYYKEKNKYLFNFANIMINDQEKIVKLIECNDNISIWDFHKGELLNIINVDNNLLYGICLYNSNALIVGCGNGKIIIY